MTLLWLDDMRDPMDTKVDWLGRFSPIGRYPYVVWVKSYDEFVAFITNNGLPDGICFDHDLGKETESELLRKGYSKKDARRLKKEEKTGYDCAKWLIEYCLDRDINIPPYGLQTSNEAGKENIDCLLSNYKKMYERTH